MATETFNGVTINLAVYPAEVSSAFRAFLNGTAASVLEDADYGTLSAVYNLLCQTEHDELAAACHSAILARFGETYRRDVAPTPQR